MAYVFTNRTGASDFMCRKQLFAVELALRVEVALPTREGISGFILFGNQAVQ
jgi:hypothetical protein